MFAGQPKTVIFIGVLIVLAAASAASITTIMLADLSEQDSEVTADQQSSIDHTDIETLLTESVGQKMVELGIQEVSVRETSSNAGNYLMEITQFGETFEYGAQYPDIVAMKLTTTPSGKVTVEFDSEARLIKAP